MMKPEKIIVVRHGESEGNADAGIYRQVPDHRLQLTERGRLQALATGRQLCTLISSGSIHFYVSPYERTRQTYQWILMMEHQPEGRYRLMTPLREDERTEGMADAG